jgi:tight adherence protein C
MNILAASIWTSGLMTVVISAMMFLAVFLLVLAVFSQGGRIQRSPQREAAIATGHTDRKTVFENAALRPIMWILLVLSHRLAVPRAKAWMRKQLIAAGSPNYYTPEEYLAISLLAGLGVGLLLEVVYFLLLGDISFMTLLLGVVVGTSLSLYQLADSAAKRLRDITKQLPYTLDLVSLAMGAGANFTEAIRTILRDGDENPLNDEFRALLAEIELGTTRRRALQNMAARVPLTSVQMLVASITQAEQLGTPLGKVLHDQSTLLRRQRSVRAENKAAVASVRILIPCLLLVMAVILTVFGPAIIQALQGGLF